MISENIQSLEYSPIHKLPLRMSAVPEIDYSEENDNCYINSAYESPSYINCKVEENLILSDQELDNRSHRENHLLNKLGVKVPAVPATAEMSYYHFNSVYENVRLDHQELCVGMSAATMTVESGNNRINPAYENAGLCNQEFRVAMSAFPETEENNSYYTSPTHESTRLDDLQFRDRMSAVPKMTEIDNYHINPFYENAGSVNQALRVGMSAFPETEESTRYYINPAYKSARLGDQEHRVGMSAVLETAESENHHIKPANENTRSGDQEFSVGKRVISDSFKSGKYHTNPAYENLRLRDQELKNFSSSQIIRRSIQLPEKDPMSNLSSRMSLEPENDSCERVKDNMNHADESTLDNNFIVEKNLNSSDQELKLNSHREMIRRSIQLPERGKLKPRTKMPFGLKKEDSGEGLNLHINIAYDSPSKINYSVEENARSDDQELRLHSHREMIRRSIQLPERGSKREPRVRMSVVSALDDFKESGKGHINLAYESSWNIDRKVEQNASTNDQVLELTYREVIRRSIQVPERQHRPRKHCCCSVT